MFPGAACMSKARQSCLNLVRSDCPEYGQSLLVEHSSPKLSSMTLRRSGWSIFTDWWRADRNLVFGSSIEKRAKSVPPTSLGRTRLLRQAPRTSPIRSMPPKAKARVPATRGQPHERLRATKAISTCQGIAVRCSVGSTFLQAKSYIPGWLQLSSGLGDPGAEAVNGLGEVGVRAPR